jgi:hypothetical protein
MSYLPRAMKARDPRFRRIFEKMGYDTKPMVAEEAPDPAPTINPPAADIAELRARYAEVFGKRPFMGWDADRLRELIAGA